MYEGEGIREDKGMRVSVDVGMCGLLSRSSCVALYACGGWLLERSPLNDTVRTPEQATTKVNKQKNKRKTNNKQQK